MLEIARRLPQLLWRRFGQMGWLNFVWLGVLAGLGIALLRISLFAGHEPFDKEQAAFFLKLGRAEELLIAQAHSGNKAAIEFLTMMGEIEPKVNWAAAYPELAGLSRQDPNTILFDLSVASLADDTVAVMLIRPGTQLYLRRQGRSTCVTEEMKASALIADFWESMYGRRGKQPPQDPQQLFFNQIVISRSRSPEYLPTAIARVCQGHD